MGPVNAKMSGPGLRYKIRCHSARKEKYCSHCGRIIVPEVKDIREDLNRGDGVGTLGRSLAE